MKRLSCAMVLLAVGVLSGCGRGGGTAGGGSGDAMEAEAAAAVMAEVGKHWEKGAEGWTTALVQGSPYAPDRFLRQCKEIKVRGVQGQTLDSSDKLNGVEFMGVAYFEETPAREAGDPGIAFQGMLGTNLMRAKGRWTAWGNFKPMELRVTKVKGAWQVADDTTMTSGKAPTGEDWARAGVR